MTNPPKLINPPIIEAVLDIECDYKEQPDIKKIEAKARKEMAKGYPNVRLIQEHQFEANLSEPPKISVKGGLQGLQFLKNDEKQVVQYRASGFSFNRLAP